MSAVAGPSKKASRKGRTPPPVDSDVESSRSGVASESESENGSDSEGETSSNSRAAAPSKGNAARNSHYEPPPGMKPVSVSSAFRTSAFEFDALSKKPGVELWALRIPADLKPSRLTALSIVKSDTVRGQLSTKSGSFQLEAAAVEAGGAGAEMAGMSFMVPRLSREGKLYRAPIEVSRRLLLTPDSGAKDAHPFVAPPKTKRAQPEGLLKFRNRAFGFDTAGPEVTEGTGGDVEVGEGVAESQTPSQAPKDKREKESKRKQRKSDADASASPKKKKKRSKE